MEDKASMLEYKVSKKDYGVCITRVLDQASPGLAAVGNVSVALAELRAGDDNVTYGDPGQHRDPGQHCGSTIINFRN